MWRFLAILVVLIPVAAHGGDWPMGGRAPDRNPVSPEESPTTDWHVGDDQTPPKNIRWSAKVGTRAIGGPVVANGLVCVGTNNKVPLDPAVQGDRGVYACFRESDGEFLYQYASPRLELDKMIADWPGSGSAGHQMASGAVACRGPTPRGPRPEVQVATHTRQSRGSRGGGSVCPTGARRAARGEFDLLPVAALNPRRPTRPASATNSAIFLGGSSSPVGTSIDPPRPDW